MTSAINAHAVPHLAHSMEDAARLLGIGRTLMFEMANDGRISTVKIGKRRLVPHFALVDFLARATDGAPQAPQSVATPIAGAQSTPALVPFAVLDMMRDALLSLPNKRFAGDQVVSLGDALDAMEALAQDAVAGRV